ncbi:hypothetical protein [Empedobacter sp. UBA6745]|uniref:hypothetical protein n=1 Tax=Empedobacter sp. UBA6745 TaxID=1946447 RepID=UPI0039C88217
MSKLIDFENFQIQLAQSPLLSVYAEFIVYTKKISIGIVIALLLLVSKRTLQQ